MRKTRLMSKLFSADTPQEYKEKVQLKMDEAHENGNATLEEDGELLQFADVDGDVIVEDQTDGMNEVTRISQNPDDENDFVMSAVEVPEDVTEEVTEEPTEEVVEETVLESDNLESIEIKRLPGVDGDHADDLVDDLEIRVKEGIEDDEKSGTEVYSLRFKNYSQKKAQMFAKIFSHCMDCMDEVVKSANVDEDVQVKFENGVMKVMSVTFGKPSKTFSFSENDEVVDSDQTDITEVIDEANKLAELAEGGITKENADEIKKLAEDVISKAEDIENEELSLKSIKSMCSKFSEEAAEVADAEDVVEEVTEEPTEEVVEETVTESNASPTVLQCEETGKWYIQEDPEKKLYDTQEEAEQVAAREFCDKTFSEPKVTLTIEDLEPASVSDLLAGPNKDKDEEGEDLEPKVDPNDSENFGRSFSITKDNETNINPLLFTEIN